MKFSFGVLFLSLSFFIISACSNGGGGSSSDPSAPGPTKDIDFKPLSVSEIEMKFVSISYCENKLEIKKLGPTTEDYTVKIQCRAYEMNALWPMLKELSSLRKSLTWHFQRMDKADAGYSVNQKNYIRALKQAYSPLEWFLDMLEKAQENSSKPELLATKSEVEYFLSNKANSDQMQEEVCKAGLLGEKIDRLGVVASFAAELSHFHQTKTIQLGSDSNGEIPSHFQIGSFSMAELQKLDGFFTYSIASWLNGKIGKLAGDEKFNPKSSVNISSHAGIANKTTISCLISKVLDHQAIQERLAAKTLPNKWNVNVFNWNKNINAKKDKFGTSADYAVINLPTKNGDVLDQDLVTVETLVEKILALEP